MHTAIASMYQVKQVQHLLAAHREELTTNKKLMVLRPNWEVYDQLEESGGLFVVGAFNDDFEMVGYSINFISPHLHYMDLRVSQNDVIFLDKAHRRGRFGLALIRATEAEAKRQGAQVHSWHVKPDTPLAAILQRSQKYKAQDLVYIKEL